MVSPDDGQLIDGHGYSLAVIVIDSAFCGVAWYICVSIFIRIFLTFRKYRSLYFWSIIITCTGVFFQPISYLLKDFQVANLMGLEVLSTASWYFMVTGQAVVLNSRLHLVVVDARRIRWVWYMIIINFFLLHIPTSVLTFCGHSPRLAPHVDFAYSVYEKIQLVGFFLQEVTISGLYIYYVRQLLKDHTFLHQTECRAVMVHLICVNVIVILLSIAVICTELANEFPVQTIFKAAVYSIKLELEFSILNRLRMVARVNRSKDGTWHPGRFLTAIRRRSSVSAKEWRNSKKGVRISNPETIKAEWISSKKEVRISRPDAMEEEWMSSRKEVRDSNPDAIEKIEKIEKIEV